MDPLKSYVNNLTRRQWIARSASGALGALGTAALADLASAAPQGPASLPHFPAKAKRVIYLFQEGGPSHLDTYDHKPVLQELDGKDLRKMPEIHRGQRLTGMTAGQAVLPLKATPFKFE
ncbi:MAG: DUF1501 domain-containing protein, partial [Planctomycetaceae bacterium]|nr:DUF1501 domain-containing protein [Planctomycetaceae bacterium]